MNPVLQVRYRLQVAAAILCLTALLTACVDCKYVDVPGKATITKIADAEGGNGKVVTFDFQPDDPQKQNAPGRSTPDTFTETISKQQFDVKHPTVGQKYQAVRSDITTGSCTPTNYQISW